MDASMNDSHVIMTSIEQKLCHIFKEQNFVPDALTVQKLAGDISHRQYFRITHSSGSHFSIKSSSKPNTQLKCKSFVLQIARPFKDPSSKAKHFVTIAKALEKLKIPAPKVLDFNEEHGWVLLDDLGDVFLQKTPSSELYLQAAKMSAFLNVNFSKKNQKLTNFGLWHEAFDLERFDFEMRFLVDNLLFEINQGFSEDFLRWSHGNNIFLIDNNRVYCHRDFHSRNLMIQNGQCHMIDFQDLRFGPLSYDIVSLICDPYVELPSELRAQAYNTWLSQIQTLSKEAELLEYVKGPVFKEELERMKLQRFWKAIGSFASVYVNKNSKGYLPYVFPSLLTIKEAQAKLTSEFDISDDEKKFFKKIENRIPEIESKIKSWIMQ